VIKPVPILAGALLVVYAYGFLSLDIDGKWTRLHEDNGAMHTSFALSHLHLGLSATRAHDLHFNPATGKMVLYGHHPPGTSLAVAAAFAATGSSSPRTARMVSIAFHLGTLGLMVALLAVFFGAPTALFGGFVIAALPMSAYFGRMVNYEPLCLFAVLLQLFGYAKFKTTGAPRWVAMIVAGVIVGALIDWPALFFAGAIVLMEVFDLRRGGGDRRLVAAIGLAGAAVLAFDLAHLALAAGSIEPLLNVVGRNVSGAEELSWGRLVLRPINSNRLYFTHTGLVAGILMATSLLRPRSRLASSLLDVDRPEVASRLLAISGGAAFAYVLAAPTWAATHAYWQFYALPYVGFSIVACLVVLYRNASRPGATAWRALLVVVVIEMLGTTAYTLNLRYSETEPYAIREVATLQQNYLDPADEVWLDAGRR